MKVWVVGQVRATREEGVVWEIQGVFSTYEDAAYECKTSHYFVGPMETDLPMPDDTVVWEGCHYPLVEGRQP